MLHDKQIILGVSGGIAAYKAVELLRLLTKAGADVHVIMTRAAQEFVTPLTFQTLSSNPVHTELFNLIAEREIGHIALADRADLFLIAPATANVIGKIAGGIADDMLTTTVMATKAPVLIAPAMNVNMYTNPIYRENEQKLARLGYSFVAPEKGMLACGWEGEGKLASPEAIFEAAVVALAPKDLAGHTVLVTAGPTREELDPVRFISNYSSGKMGYALAKSAAQRGARVILVSGPVSMAAPYGVELVNVNSAKEMREAVLQRAEECTVIIKAAAVADYRPTERSSIKIKKQSDERTINLIKNPDILAELGTLKKRPYLVGFAAETGKLREFGLKKLKEKNADMIVANDVSQPDAGFNVETNRALLLFQGGREVDCQLMSKEALAGEILNHILAELK
ncbi:bifunctional phosphopantothenoylcysteine decarboxylase/phosphopantothenate--cysteine ligase CoaBC [Pelotalea chapellei]|uniref:Coenzyme A biosynthesis bifunctional protein CoaBC n=1 Tax=Pelotalea chapellei TaxID=44671 RepID=A0ABS5U4I0_9BACT|nr:bifunctional phosphopantothenoylcysteine decarboxylase/phosphopantothenate--cysteine ligase CoaBC [Pelotalea chapellei]MBT1070559.1 bifunctional phosphopantothenoylcysteine decarboxylase/phosphopantothenate--cysteine ligase CoaBC [Pelotalea chapellei]